MKAWLSGLPREKADILLLLLAAAMVLAPHALHLPPWLSAAAAAPLLWRANMTVRGRRQPQLAVLVPLALLGIAGVYASYGSVLGRDAGVAMLVLLLALKSLEMHGRRDIFVFVFLSFFLLLANFFHAQGILSAAWMLATVIVLLAALLSAQYGTLQPRLAQRLGLLGRMLALAIPLSAVMFLAVPRPDSPLWGAPHEGAQARTGLSDSMQAGAIASLALSGEPVFTARFSTPIPPQDQLYWRGVVLGDYDGATWSRRGAGRHAPASDSRIDITLEGQPSQYEVTLQASGQRRIFALDLPRSIERLPGNPYVVSSALEVLTIQPITSTVRYRVSSQPRYRLQTSLSPEQQQPWLALPAGSNPRSVAWARALRGSGTQMLAPTDAIAAVLDHFHHAPFRYTLQPPLLGKHGVDDFLFVTQAGFCEHYAGSFVVLMRAMGIPARVVTGYQGGTRAGADGSPSLTVRQSDAHAWSEVWLAGRGWVRVDPTGAVAPLRTERNLNAALPPAPSPLSAWRALAGLDGGAHGALAAWRQQWQQAEHAWNSWALDTTPQRQRAMLDSLKNLPATTLALACAVLALLSAVAGALVCWRQAGQGDPLDALYAQFCRQQAQRGYSRAPHEGPHGYAARLAAGKATPEAHAAIAQFLAIYAAMKYGNANPDEQLRARRSLRRLLTQCR
ncbi:transglutaminase TgpA family protein [Janthinobacterium sp. DSP2-3-3]|uniref:transglutaminase TgpA family protein n=1 Tax=Janthinobacterium sp. DSP2-3-3 TaxID=2804596 RepID=UPI003CF93CB5